MEGPDNDTGILDENDPKNHNCCSKSRANKPDFAKIQISWCSLSIESYWYLTNSQCNFSFHGSGTAAFLSVLSHRNKIYCVWGFSHSYVHISSDLFLIHFVSFYSLVLPLFFIILPLRTFFFSTSVLLGILSVSRYAHFLSVVFIVLLFKVALQ